MAGAKIKQTTNGIRASLGNRNKVRLTVAQKSCRHEFRQQYVRARDGSHVMGIKCTKCSLSGRPR